ncbi:hypothetical protein HWV07_04250 [Natronomonas salina]|nr:hypothetical protein [Natronomonas salina]QLD88286.1 hypothetical protein HWV07_04250 [Natronomonas salina]
MLSDTEAAAAAFCGACSKAFYVVDTPTACPYCGGDDVSPEYPVAVRPE